MMRVYSMSGELVSDCATTFDGLRNIAVRMQQAGESGMSCHGSVEDHYTGEIAHLSGECHVDQIIDRFTVQH